MMALERIPADIRAAGGVSRMSDPKMIKEIQEAVSIPVMAKCRIGHFVESHDINGSQGKKINKNINDVMRYIDSNYMTDINVDNICKLFSFSSSHFSRLFKQNTGEAFSRYLSKVRLEHAIVLLSNTDKPIDQIAYECGFKSTSYFSYAFKKEFLVSPLKYRMQMKG